MLTVYISQALMLRPKAHQELGAVTLVTVTVACRHCAKHPPGAAASTTETITAGRIQRPQPAR